ncbi:uncharacterized protein [Panulirus ornatus]|uniref:uncharacterized protein n=1 Tax=Panulirus ornatus TaxID=150431 RepID=UPI003A89A141
MVKVKTGIERSVSLNGEGIWGQGETTKIFPSAWKQALVQPIPKKGDRSNLSNYCPIALTSATSKIFDSPKVTFSDFGEIFVRALDISKALDWVWHKSLPS